MNADNPLNISHSSHTPTRDEALAKVCSYLEHASKNGYWSYIPQKGASAEATAWCALALYSADQKTSARQTAVDYFLKHQNMKMADGPHRLLLDDPNGAPDLHFWHYVSFLPLKTTQ